MISLKSCKEPYGIDLPYEVTVTVRPLTSMGMMTAQTAARKQLATLEKEFHERKDAGIMPDTRLPDLENDAVRDGFYQSLLIKELAFRHILSWTGVVGPDGRGDATINRENISALMELYPIGERFFEAFTLKQVLLNAAKNGFGLSADGISSPVEGQDIAQGAGNRISRVPGER